MPFPSAVVVAETSNHSNYHDSNSHGHDNHLTAGAPCPIPDDNGFSIGGLLPNSGFLHNNEAPASVVDRILINGTIPGPPHGPTAGSATEVGEQELRSADAVSTILVLGSETAGPGSRSHGELSPPASEPVAVSIQSALVVQEGSIVVAGGEQNGSSDIPRNHQNAPAQATRPSATTDSLSARINNVNAALEACQLEGFVRQFPTASSQSDIVLAEEFILALTTLAADFGPSEDSSEEELPMEILTEGMGPDEMSALQNLEASMNDAITAAIAAFDRHTPPTNVIAAFDRYQSLVHYGSAIAGGGGSLPPSPPGSPPPTPPATPPPSAGPTAAGGYAQSAESPFYYNNNEAAVHFELQEILRQLPLVLRVVIQELVTVHNNLTKLRATIHGGVGVNRYPTAEYLRDNFARQSALIERAQKRVRKAQNDVLNEEGEELWDGWSRDWYMRPV